jgi:mediator of RNA polymerase II transcription subunit 31
MPLLLGEAIRRGRLARDSNRSEKEYTLAYYCTLILDYFREGRTTTEGSMATEQPDAVPHQAAAVFAGEGEALPANRFELELEFVQALASPAYLHFLATTKSGDGLLLQDAEFRAFLRYLSKTWRQPAYSRFLNFPHALYFLELLIGNGSNSNNASDNSSHAAVVKEWTIPQFRNFCHQQQFLAWQHRHAELYGVGTLAPSAPSPMDTTTTGDPAPGGEGQSMEGLSS